MGDSNQEWWTNEVSEKFKSLITLVKSFFLFCLIFKSIMMVIHPNFQNIFLQIVLIIIVFMLAYVGVFLDGRSPYLQVAYAMCVTEAINLLSIIFV